MSESKIAAVSRTEFGKGAARRTRRAGLVPAVLYGHGTDPVHLSMPGHEVLLALRVANAVLEIEVDGGKPQLALAKQVQRDPIRGDIEHVDLVIVRKGEKVTVEVNVHVIGEPAIGTMTMLEAQTVTLEAEATNLPESIEVSVEGLIDGAQVRGSDLVLPAGSTFVGDLDAIIVAISTPQGDEEPTEDVVADEPAVEV